MPSIKSFTSKKIIKNIFWSSADAVIYPLLLIVATPIFIHHLGPQLYGVWMLVNTIMASIGVLNAGLGDATIKIITKYISSREPDKINKIISAAFSIYVIIGGIVVGVAIITAYFVRIYNWFDIEHAHRAVASNAIQIAGVTLSFKFMEQIFLSVFKGFERYDLAAIISVIGKILTVVINIVLALAGASLTVILFSSCVTTFLFLVVEIILANRFSGFKSFYPSVELLYIKEVFAFGIWTWFQSVIGILSGQIDKFIVVSIAGMTVFAYYSIALTIFTQIHTVFAACVAWLFPMVSKKIHDGEDVSMLYRQSQFLFSSFTLISITAFSLVKDPIILWWLGDTTFQNTNALLNLFIWYNLVLALTIIPSYFLNANGDFKTNTYLAVITLILRLICIPVFYNFFGIKGLAIGLLISGLLSTPLQITIFIKRIFARNDWVMGIKILIPSIVYYVIYINYNLLISTAVTIALVTYYWLIFKPAALVRLNRS